MSETVFQQAARVFDGWTDPETGLAVLRIRHNGANAKGRWNTIYHQERTFHNGGRNILLKAYGRWRSVNLTTGEEVDLLPERRIGHIAEKTNVAVTWELNHLPRRSTILYDLTTGRELARHSRPDWPMHESTMLADGRRAMIGYHQGEMHTGFCRSEIHLLDISGETKLIHEAEGFFCNHIQGNPTDPDLFSYDRWPSPRGEMKVIIHVMKVDGSHHAPLPDLPETEKPGPVWGWQRDHYVWSADGKRILSYFNKNPEVTNDHFAPGWWISATDWRTGEDFSAPYPPGRWGCNFNTTPDGKFIVSAGGPDFHKLYAVDIERLRDGWNERALCSYPSTTHHREAGGPYAMPWVLPDQSGVIFTAGWHGPDDGVYLVEWPKELR